MLSHDAIWQAIDRLALRHNLSPSGLARMAGLDATIFNPSKRVKSDGRPRWPSTESIAKILQATHTSPWLFFLPPLDDLDIEVSSRLVPPRNPGLETKSVASQPRSVPWPPLLPDHRSSGLHLIEIDHDRLSPCYDRGDLLLISTDWPVERGDLVAVYPVDDAVMVYRLDHEDHFTLRLTKLMTETGKAAIAKEQLDWWAKILWVAK